MNIAFKKQFKITNVSSIFQYIADSCWSLHRELICFVDKMGFFQKLIINSKNVLVKCYGLVGHISTDIKILLNIDLGTIMSNVHNINLINVNL